MIDYIDYTLNPSNKSVLWKRVVEDFVNTYRAGYASEEDEELEEQEKLLENVGWTLAGLSDLYLRVYIGVDYFHLLLDLGKGDYRSIHFNRRRLLNLTNKEAVDTITDAWKHKEQWDDCDTEYLAQNLPQTLSEVMCSACCHTWTAVTYILDNGKNIICSQCGHDEVVILESSKIHYDSNRE
jgi:hypothetical protein